METPAFKVSWLRTLSATFLFVVSAAAWLLIRSTPNWENYDDFWFGWCFWWRALHFLAMVSPCIAIGCLKGRTGLGLVVGAIVTTIGLAFVIPAIY